MISGFSASANVSQFAHVSLICGSGIAQFKLCQEKSQVCRHSRFRIGKKIDAAPIAMNP